MSRLFRFASDERRVICENCGQIVETEEIGGPNDRHPEMGRADRLLPIEECPFCGDFQPEGD